MNITDLRATIGQKITGDSSFDGSVSAYHELSADDQIKITNEMKHYIASNPDAFSQAQVNIAQTPDISLTENYSVGDAIYDFGNEAANQAVSINNSVNPFSEANRGKLFWLAVAGVGLYFLGPMLFEGGAKLISSSKKHA